MAELSVQQIDKGGLQASYASAESGGDTYPNDSERIFLHVKNGDSAEHTVTISALVSETERPGFGSLSVSDISVAIPAGEDRFIGPVPRTAYGRKPDIQYDDVTSVSIAAMEV